MRAFYERWLWIMKLFSVQESRLSPRAVNLTSRAACREKHVRNYSKLLIDVLRGTLLSKSELQELESPQVRANRFSYPQRHR